jgi:hypothetical protein
VKKSRHFEAPSDGVSRETAHIRTMIADLDRVVQILACDIATEEERSGISDRSDPAYSMLGRNLSARRDNLLATIAALDFRLENNQRIAA